METSVSFEARYAPSSYPTHGPTRLRGEDPVDPLLLGVIPSALAWPQVFFWRWRSPLIYGRRPGFGPPMTGLQER